jgi:transcriptional regulator with XRE-family HTH domain
MDAVPSVAFGTLLRRYRVAAGLTQEELAERAGISRRSLGDLERGVAHTPRKDTVALLAAALALAPPERSAFVEAARRVGAPAASIPVSPSPSAPPFVGRARELALLERHLAGEGPPVLLLAGEPGIGKTRLLHAAIPRAVAQGFHVLEGGCQRRGGHEPYAPLLGALQRHLRSRRPAQLQADLRGCAWLVRLLSELADGPIAPLPTWTLPPEQERRLIVQAVVRLLANVAGPAGTLLVLDDLQWAGPDALDLLATLVRAAAEVPLRVLGAYRDTEVQSHDPLSVLLADLAHAGLAARRLLAPLDREDAAHLLDDLLVNAGDADSALRERVLERAGGVPFVLVSCVQGLRGGDAPGGRALGRGAEHPPAGGGAARGGRGGAGGGRSIPARRTSAIESRRGRSHAGRPSVHTTCSGWCAGSYICAAGRRQRPVHRPGNRLPPATRQRGLPRPRAAVAPRSHLCYYISRNLGTGPLARPQRTLVLMGTRKERA